MPRDRRPYLILPAAALICILPLIFHGPSCGHDFTFHLLNWFEAADQFRHGNLHPQWAVSPAWNAGEPRFVFYPPLSWSLGAILGLLMKWTWTPIAYTWLALTASGLTMHRLARAHATANSSLLAATLYLANPYMLFTAYERTAYAELLAAAFLPVLFHTILKPRPSISALAAPLALLWLTNAPAAVMGTYTLALLGLIRLTQTARVPHPSQRHRDGWGLSHPASRLALTIAAGTTLGLALAAFYILPAATERPLVQIAMVIIPGMRIDDNTLFHHTGITEDALAHDAVLHTASVLAVILLSLTAAALLFVRTAQSANATSPTPKSSPTFRAAGEPASQTTTRQAIILPLTALTIATALLLTPVALPVWHHAPELAFLQFPWRLLAIQATALSLAAALAFDKLPAPRRSPGRSQEPLYLKSLNPESPTRPLATTLTGLALAAALTAAAYPTFHQPCDPEDTVQTRLTAFQAHQGAEPTDEYTPAPADNDSLAHTDPPFWLSPNPDAPPPPNTTPGPAPRDLTLAAPIPEYLILNLRQYPAWHLTLNDRPVPPAALALSPRADGLITLLVPAGTDRIVLTYQPTPLEHTADALSILAVLLPLAIWLRKIKSKTP